MKKKLQPMTAACITAVVPVRAIERWLVLQFLSQARDADWEEQEKRDELAELLEAGQPWRKTNQHCPACHEPNSQAEPPSGEEWEDETAFTMTKRMMGDLQAIIKTAHKPDHGLQGSQKRLMRKLHKRLHFILEGENTKNEAAA